MMMRRTFAAGLVALGLILLVVAPVAWQLTRPDSVLGDVAAVESALRDTDSAVLPGDVGPGGSAPNEAPDPTDDGSAATTAAPLR